MNYFNRKQSKQWQQTGCPVQFMASEISGIPDGMPERLNLSGPHGQR
jgi:hypothetical protein